MGIEQGPGTPGATESASEATPLGEIRNRVEVIAQEIRKEIAENPEKKREFLIELQSSGMDTNLMLSGDPGKKDEFWINELANKRALKEAQNQGKVQ